MAARPKLKQRAIEILLRLKQHYPNSTCALNYETPLQLLVAV
ncbi:MAG: endonuclease III, partial [Cyanobacteria bacterium J06648_11]